MEDLEQKVKQIIAEQLGKNEADIKNEASFIEDLGADSLDTVELVMALEDAFKIEIPTNSRKTCAPFSRPSTSSRPTSRPDASAGRRAGVS